MATELIESHRAKAEIFHGEELCRKKSIETLEEYALPKGLMPIEISEFGYVKSTGFIWYKTKAKQQHKFRLISRTVSYDTVITMFAEKGRVKDLIGIKAKEMLIWLTLSEIFLDDSASGKIVFVTSNGLRRSSPVAAFELEEEKGKNLENAVTN